MRTLLLSLVIFGVIQTSQAQPRLKGIILKDKLGYNQGDTILVKGYFNALSSHPNRFVAQSVNGNNRLIPTAYVKLIDTIQNFWDYQWFLNRSGKIAQSGHPVGVRNKLNNECAIYLQQLKEGGLLDDNAETIDYLNDLITRIGAPSLIKGMNAKVNVHIIKSDVKDIFSFDNGTIFLTTGLLVNTATEEELVRLLVNEMVHITGDHQAISRKRQNTGTAIMAGILIVATAALIVAASKEDNHPYEYHNDWFFDGFVYENYGDYPPPIAVYARPNSVSYNQEQIENARNQSNCYMTSEYGKIDHLPDAAYLRNISGIVTYTAWNKYFKADYKEALKLINRLETYDVAGSDDYLLKAKVYRKLYNTDEAKYEALRYIQIAKNMNGNTNIELLKEEGLIYYQLQDMPKAHSSFDEYRYALDKVGVNNDDDRREVTWADQMLQKTR
jgi:hypothetical protein